MQDAEIRKVVDCEIKGVTVDLFYRWGILTFGSESALGKNLPAK